MKPAGESRVHLRGFAVMDPERRRQISSAGGKLAHALGRAHKWTPAEARDAGMKGATVRWQNAVAARRAKLAEAAT